MRLLQVSPFFSPQMGGSARVVYQSSKHLSERGHEVTIVASDYALQRARFPKGPFRVVTLPCALARWGFYPTPSLVAWAAHHVSDFDIIHLHELRTFQNAVVRHYALRARVPYVLSAHGTLPVIIQRQAAKRAYDWLFGHRLLRDAECLVAVSDVESEQYRQAGLEPERIRRIHNGLDLAEFADLPRRGVFRDRLGITGGTRLILYLGRLHQRKRIDQVIDAFALLEEARDGLLLAVVGPDEGELASLQAHAARLGLGQRVCFPGALYGQDRLAAYVDADVLASPAVHEIFGLVPFEALMCGTPVIVADDCGSGRLVAEAGAGYAVPAGNVVALADALRETLDHPAEAHARVHAGQAFIREHLDWQVLAADLEALYGEVISNHA